MQWIGIVLEAITPEILSAESAGRAKALGQVRGVSCIPSSMRLQMKTETSAGDQGSLVLTLTGDEILLLRLALERATFQDTPPQHQKAIYNFAEDLLRSLAPYG